MKRLTLTCFALAVLTTLFAAACRRKQTEPEVQSVASMATKPPTEVPIEDLPPAGKPTQNPLIGGQLFVDPESLAMLKANAIRATQPEQAAILDRIANQPQAMWFGEWNSDIYRSVEHLVNRATQQGQIAVMIAYNVPFRDCGQYSAGGLKEASEYRRWIRLMGKGIRERKAAVILEPDALPQLTQCLNEEQQKQRVSLILDAVRVLRQNPNTAVYVDAGHARWVEAEVIAPRLKAAGVDEAHGFSLNTSNYVSTEENLEYGKKLSALLGGAHFVIDTSRNGAGPAPGDEWCNPPGRKIGEPPDTNPAEPLLDALLWLKRPGESDGTCNGGPQAGAFWLERALELAQ